MTSSDITTQEADTSTAVPPEIQELFDRALAENQLWDAPTPQSEANLSSKAMTSALDKEKDALKNIREIQRIEDRELSLEESELEEFREGSNAIDFISLNATQNLTHRERAALLMIYKRDGFEKAARISNIPESELRKLVRTPEGKFYLSDLAANASLIQEEVQSHLFHTAIETVSAIDKWIKKISDKSSDELTSKDLKLIEMTLKYTVGRKSELDVKDTRASNMRKLIEDADKLKDNFNKIIPAQIMEVISQSKVSKTESVTYDKAFSTSL